MQSNLKAAETVPTQLAPRFPIADSLATNLHYPIPFNPQSTLPTYAYASTALVNISTIMAMNAVQPTQSSLVPISDHNYSLYTLTQFTSMESQLVISEHSYSKSPTPPPTPAGEVPFRCHLCKISFSQGDIFLLHMKRHSLEDGDVPTVSNP